jgi:hypothetical protein
MHVLNLFILLLPHSLAQASPTSLISDKSQQAEEKQQVVEAEAVYVEGVSCGLCRKAKEAPTALDCGHLFCRACVRTYLLDLIAKKKVVSIHCPTASCPKEMSPNNIKVWCDLE